jgi:hypothetical protein
MACRGTGQVISNLGGEPKSVSCPWCNGTGTRVPGIDAQASWREQQAADAAADGGGSAGAQAAGEGRQADEDGAVDEGALGGADPAQ